MNIVHITAWYPNRTNPFDAIWIKRLVEALPNIGRQKVYHIAVTPGTRFSLRQWDEDAVHHCVWYVPTKRWILIEVLNFLLLLYYFRVKRIHKHGDVVNFHIAYPQLVFWGALKAIIKKPVVICEHWSAYHYNFGVRKPLPRIQRIFKHGLPVITVSRALLHDIETFSQCKVERGFVIPNVVDTRVFTRHETVAVNENTFLMLSQWKPPKRPDVVIKAFAKLIYSDPKVNYRLRIGGYGAQLNEMKNLVDSMNLSENIVFLGTLDSANLAIEMNQCSAFVHCSDYETFSVVCAESVSCGTPVIVSAVGGITEFVNSTNGRLVTDNTVSGWFSALREFNSDKFDRKAISTDAEARFSADTVGRRYVETLRNLSCVEE